MPIINRNLERQPALFFGTAWPQRASFRQASLNLPAKSCLLVVDDHKPKQIEIMRQVAQTYEERGQSVFVWLAHRKNAIHSKIR